MTWLRWNALAQLGARRHSPQGRSSVLPSSSLRFQLGEPAVILRSTRFLAAKRSSACHLRRLQKKPLQLS
jgi:hypothetical protein